MRKIFEFVTELIVDSAIGVGVDIVCDAAVNRVENPENKSLR